MVRIHAVLLLAAVVPVCGWRQGGPQQNGALDPSKSSTEGDNQQDMASAEFQAVSPEEERLIVDMIEPIFPEAMGRGHDVRDGRRPYNRLEYVAAWKTVDTNPHLQSYLEKRDQSNAAYKSQNRSFWVRTVRDKEQQFAKKKGILGENEYLLFRGSSPKRLRSFFSGSTKGTKGDSSDSSVATFGGGIYITDAFDKMDQYVRDEKNEALRYLAELVGTQDQQVKQLQSSGNIKLGVVVRTYLGHHIEVAFENLLCKRLPLEQHERMWYYRDGETKEDKEIHDTPSNRFNRTPPFQNYDSVKVVGRSMEMEFFEGIQPGNPNAFAPLKCNEYLLFDESRVAAYYLVAYKRNLCDTEACKEDDAAMKQQHRLRGDNPCREGYDRNSLTAIGRSRKQDQPEKNYSPRSWLLISIASSVMANVMFHVF